MTQENKKKSDKPLPEVPKLAKPWDLVNPNIGRVSPEVKAARLDACQNCEFFFKLSRQCRKCGCFMDAKTGLPHAECPVGKWGRAKAV